MGRKRPKWSVPSSPDKYKKLYWNGVESCVVYLRIIDEAWRGLKATKELRPETERKIVEVFNVLRKVLIESFKVSEATIKEIWAAVDMVKIAPTVKEIYDRNKWTQIVMPGKATKGPVEIVLPHGAVKEFMKAEQRKMDRLMGGKIENKALKLVKD